MDDDTDTFTIETEWKACTAALRLWCLSNPADAIQDAATISTWHERESGPLSKVVVVESDVDELHMPLEVFRRLTNPREATVRSPEGNTLAHVDAVDALPLVAALLTFAGQAYMRVAAARGNGTFDDRMDT